MNIYVYKESGAMDTDIERTSPVTQIEVNEALKSVNAQRFFVCCLRGVWWWGWWRRRLRPGGLKLVGGSLNKLFEAPGIWMGFYDYFWGEWTESGRMRRRRKQGCCHCGSHWRVVYTVNCEGPGPSPVYGFAEAEFSVLLSLFFYLISNKN